MSYFARSLDGREAFRNSRSSEKCLGILFEDGLLSALNAKKCTWGEKERAEHAFANIACNSEPMVFAFFFQFKFPTFLSINLKMLS